MSDSCECSKAFPPRDFKSASAADDYMSGIRMSSVYRFKGQSDGPPARELYKCRTCGRDWACTIPASPPYRWGPLVESPSRPPTIEIPAPKFAVPARPASPHVDVPSPAVGSSPRPPAGRVEMGPIPRVPPPAAAPVPAAAPMFLEVGGPIREAIAGFSVLYEREARDDVPVVMKSLMDWRPGLSSWATSAGLTEVEIELGSPVAKKLTVWELFAQTWPPDLVNPAWRGIKGGREVRPVHVRGIRKRTTQGAGFQGEYYLVVISTKSKRVVAWMMAEAN